MKHQVIYRSNWAIPTSLLIIFALVGCQPPAPTQAPPAALATSTSGATSTPAPASSTPPASSPAPASPTVGVPKGNLPPDVLYQDDFTNPATNWAAAESPDFFVGYHEPQYYHIEIRSPHYKAPVISIPDPEKHNYPDATIELQVFTVAGKTAPEGDFRYGLVFRRSGDNYYAFTISPRTKAWSVFKSSPNGIVPLKDGTDDSIHDLDGTDTLRVDAQGPNFLFHINDRLIDQVVDPDYPTGEIGLYAETIDSTRVHIHFDTLTIREVDFSLACKITNGGMFNVRTGPGKTSASVAVVSDGDTLAPTGVSTDREWIQIKLEGSNNLGWVSYSPGYMSCTPSIDLFPIVSP